MSGGDGDAGNYACHRQVTASTTSPSSVSGKSLDIGQSSSQTQDRSSKLVRKHCTGERA